MPENLEGKELKVLVMENLDENDPEDWSKLPGTERLKILQQFKGSARYPDAAINKYDVYEQ